MRPLRAEVGVTPDLVGLGRLLLVFRGVLVCRRILLVRFLVGVRSLRTLRGRSGQRLGRLLSLEFSDSPFECHHPLAVGFDGLGDVGKRPELGRHAWDRERSSVAGVGNDEDRILAPARGRRRDDGDRGQQNRESEVAENTHESVCLAQIAGSQDAFLFMQSLPPSSSARSMDVVSVARWQAVSGRQAG